MSKHDSGRRRGRVMTALGLGLALAIGVTPSAVAAQIRVAIVAKGDVGQYAGMCGAPAGTDSLGGVLELKDLADDGSALYEGRLMRVTDVVACGTKPAPTEDQVAWCSAQLSGSSPMQVTLEVYEGDRGAWVKSEPVSPPLPSEPVRKAISGCTEPGEWLDAYPDDGWMSGLGFETVPSGPLGRGTYQTGSLTLTVY